MKPGIKVVVDGVEYKVSAVGSGKRKGWLYIVGEYGTQYGGYRWVRVEKVSVR